MFIVQAIAGRMDGNLVPNGLSVAVHSPSDSLYNKHHFIENR